MTKEIRWRIVTLQVVLILVLGFCAGFLYWGSNFVNGMVHDELAAQKISFPPPSEIKAGGALDPMSSPLRSGTTPGNRSTMATRLGSTPTTSSAST